MKTPRRKFSASFKAKVAIEAIKEQTSLQDLAAKFELHPTQISSWKREFLKNADLAFGSKSEKEDSDSDTAPLYSKIGQLQVENDFFKESLGQMSTTERRQKVVKSHPRLSLVQQCIILNIHRSGLYYKPKSESPLNLRIMKDIDVQFLEHPYYGVERMTDYLNLDLGYHVNIKRIRRLYKVMGLQTIYRKPKTTIRDPKSYKFPYLLKDLIIERPNQLWQTDITYIPMFRGFMYMNAIIDVYSRKILNWSISNSMDKEWCIELLEDTIVQYGAPEIHNSDQGVQYTSTQYIDVLKKHNIQISMDSKGRALDNIFIERFWKSLKYEKIYLNPPNGGVDLYQIVRQYIEFYNTKRRHTEIGKVPPDQIYNLKKIAS